VNVRITGEASVAREAGREPDRWMTSFVAAPGELRWIGRSGDVALGEVLVDRTSITSQTVLALSYDDGCMTFRQGRHRGPITLEGLAECTEIAFGGLTPWDGPLAPYTPEPRFLIRDRAMLTNQNALIRVPDLRCEIFLRWEPTAEASSPRAAPDTSVTPAIGFRDLPPGLSSGMYRHTLQLMIVVDTIDRVRPGTSQTEKLEVIKQLTAQGDLERQRGAGEWTVSAVQQTKHQGTAALRKAGYRDLWEFGAGRFVPVGLVGSLALKTEQAVRKTLPGP